MDIFSNSMNSMKAILYQDTFMEEERKFLMIKVNIKENGKKIRNKDKEYL